MARPEATDVSIDVRDVVGSPRGDSGSSGEYGDIRVALDGEIDIAAQPQVLSTLAQAIARRSGFETVVVDLSRVVFMDCCGLGSLIWARRTLGPHLVLSDPSPAVVRLLHLTNLYDSFRFADQRR